MEHAPSALDGGAMTDEQEQVIAIHAEMAAEDIDDLVRDLTDRGLSDLQIAKLESRLRELIRECLSE